MEGQVARVMVVLRMRQRLPLFQADVSLHFLQMRLPTQSLSNGFLQDRQIRVLRVVGVSVSGFPEYFDLFILSYTTGKAMCRNLLKCM